VKLITRLRGRLHSVLVSSLSQIYEGSPRPSVFAKRFNRVDQVKQGCRLRGEGGGGRFKQGGTEFNRSTPLGRPTSIKRNRYSWRPMKSLRANQWGGLYVREQTEQGNSRSSQR